jgi:CheY-like chemotaxis protein
LRAIIDRKPDAIITDIGLPGMDGVAFAHWVRDDGRSADMPVALMSAWEDALAFPQPPHGFVSPISNLALIAFSANMPEHHSGKLPARGSASCRTRK